MQHLRSWMGAAKDPPSDFPRDVPGDRGDRGDRAGRRPREEKGRLVSKAWGKMGVAMGFYRVWHGMGFEFWKVILFDMGCFFLGGN